MDSIGEGDDQREVPEPRSFSRRMALAGVTGLAGLGLANSGRASGTEHGDDGSDSPENGQAAPERHDHSGEYGTSNRLGEAAPLERIDVEDVQADFISGVEILRDGLDEIEVRARIAAPGSDEAMFLVPPGASWTLTDTLEIPNRTWIYGAVSRLYHDDHDTFKKGFDGTLAEVGSHCTLDSVAFNGNKEAGFEGDGLHLIDQRENRFIRCTVRQNAGDGVVMDNVYMSYFHRSYWYWNDGWGLRIRDDLADHDGHMSQNTFNRVEIALNGEGGVRYELDEQVSVYDNCSVYSNKGPAFEFATGGGYDATGIAVRNGYIVWNDGPVYCVRGGDWTNITLEDSILVDNVQSPSADLTRPVGQIHVEDGRADVTVRSSHFKEHHHLYTAVNERTQSFEVIGGGVRKTGGHISGPETLFTAVNTATLDGDVDVKSGVGLDPRDGGGLEHFGDEEQELDPDAFLIQNKAMNFDASVDELEDVESVSVDEDFAVVEGERAIDGDVWITYDDWALYLAAAIDDAEHAQDDDAESLDRGDSIQVAIAEGEPGERDTYSELTIGLTDDGPGVYRARYSDGSVVAEGVLDEATAIITRDDDARRTVYEVGLPWDALEADPDGVDLGLAVAIADYDDSGDSSFLDNIEFLSWLLGDDDVTGRLEWPEGSFEAADPSWFQHAQLKN